MRRALSAWLAGGAAVLLCGAGHASAPVVRAAGMPTTPEQLAARALPPAANVAPAGAPAADGLRRPFAVGGFRSAYFGMDEQQVRAAIAHDFGLAPDSILVRDNRTEGTSVLIARTPLPPGPGDALISYILGASQHRLIHVNVMWAADAAATPAIRDAMANAGLQLSRYFRKQGWPRSAPIRTGLTSTGILMFQATDAGGASIAVEARGVALVRKADGATQTSKATGPAMLRISFAQDPAHPDVATRRQALSGALPASQP